MNATEKKELMGKYAKKLENAIKREASVMKEIENDKALIKYLEGQKTSGAAFDNTVYESYDAWIETIKKLNCATFPPCLCTSLAAAAAVPPVARRSS